MIKRIFIISGELFNGIVMNARSLHASPVSAPLRQLEIDTFNLARKKDTANDRYSGAIAETTTIEDKLSETTTVLLEIELGLFTVFLWT